MRLGRGRAAAACRAFVGRAAAGLAVACLAAAGLAALGGCGDKPAAGPAGGAAAADSTAAADTSRAGAAAEKSVKVEVAPVRRGDLVISVRADGTIRTPRSVDVRTRIPGELVEVLVRDGDRVREGQLLARIDPREYRLALDEARARYVQALSLIAAEGDSVTVNQAALDTFAARRARLDGNGEWADLPADTRRDRLLAVELEALRDGAFRDEAFAQRTGLTEARVAEERARLNLANTEIRAPFAGVVHGVTVVPGAVLSGGAAICQLYDNARLEAAVNVLEADLGDLAVGRPALVAIPATGDTLRARIEVLSPRLDDQSRTCEALLRFPNPDGRWRPGMFVRAEVAGWIHRDLLLVPRAAILVRDERPLVFKVGPDGRAQWLYVDVGRQNDRWTEITAVHSGGELAPGDRVVVSNHLTLAHEARLEIEPAAAPADRWLDAEAGPDGEPAP